MTQLSALTIHESRLLLDKREISATELTRAVLDRIGALDEKIGAYLFVDEKNALEQAKAADAAIAAGEAGPLTGIPLAVKDLMCTQGMRTSCASKILDNFVPPYDAFVIRRIKEQKAVIVGKTNMDEFAMGSSTETSAFQLTRNPWNFDKIPGGSSGGSAAATAADMCIGSLGSDTGGSIRQPASHCGVVGLKPTYGRVSRMGLVAFASSLDQIGPITKTVKDAAMVLSCVAGHDPADSTSVPRPVPDYVAGLSGDIKGMRLGFPKEAYTAEGVDPQVMGAMENAKKTFQDLGAVCVEVSLPNTKHVVAVYYVIAPCEASSNLARYDGVRYGFRDKAPDDIIDMYRMSRTKGFGPEVQRRIIIGTYCLSAGYYDAYYGKASQVRTLIRRDYEKAFETCDAIVMPVAPTCAFGIGENIDDPLTMYMSDIFTLSANLAGVPGISIPCGFSADNLPIGLQLLGSHFNEPAILKAAHCFEQATEFHLKKPAL